MPAAPQAGRPPWYAGGLRFTCTQCGNCCGGAPGYVWVTDDDVARIARSLSMPVQRFVELHVRDVGVRRSLKERPDGDCEFLARDGSGKALCSIYAERPMQCRTWPFWQGNLESRRAWAEAAEGCPGINRGQHHPLPVIQAALSRNGVVPAVL